ncbi:MAG TPA: enoyl-CoA hydratase-related protein [Longimicrobiales bacterium]
MSVLYDVADGIATLTLNRPEKRNALDDATIAALKEHFAKAETDEDVRVIVLRGEGTDFCAGGDLSQLEKIAASASREENLADAMHLGDLFIQMRRLKKPIIAAVRGNALAGGAGLASACDVVIAEDGAVFGYPEVKLGFVPAMVMAMLTRIIGEKKAFELAALGNSISAREAHRIGLVSRITSSANFPDDVQAVAKELAQRSSSAVQLIKGLVYGLEGRSFESAIRYGAEINVEARATPDCQTGVRRFLESRKKQ